MRYAIAGCCLAASILAACGGGTADGTKSSGTGATSLTASHTHVVSDYHTIVQQLYIAYFGRPADPTGLANFAAALDQAHASNNIQALNATYGSNPAIRALVDAFGTSQESQALYTGDTVSFVTAVYRNVLNRAPDQEGLNFWVNAINQGILTRANASFSIMAGALANTTPQGQTDGALINRRVSASSSFTAALTNPALQNTYVGNTAAAIARDMLKGITGSSDAAAVQAAINATLPVLAVAATPSAPEGQQLRGYLSMVANQLVYINTDRSLYNAIPLSQFEGTTGMYDFASGSRTVNTTTAVPARVASPAAPMAALGLRVDKFVQKTNESQAVGNQSVIGRVAFNLVEREGTAGIRANEVAESMRFVIDGVVMGTNASGELTTVQVREGAQMHVQGRNAAGIVVQESIPVSTDAIRLLPISQVLDNYGDNSSVVVLLDLEAAFAQAGQRLAALENIAGYFATQVTLSTAPILRPAGQSDAGTAIPAKALIGESITVNTQAPVTGAGISGNAWIRMYPPQN